MLLSCFRENMPDSYSATVLGPTSLAASNSDQQQPVVIEAGESDSGDDLGKAMEGLGLDSKAKVVNGRISHVSS